MLAPGLAVAGAQPPHMTADEADDAVCTGRSMGTERALAAKQAVVHPRQQRERTLDARADTHPCTWTNTQARCLFLQSAPVLAYLGTSARQRMIHYTGSCCCATCGGAKPRAANGTRAHNGMSARAAPNDPPESTSRCGRMGPKRPCPMPAACSRGMVGCLENAPPHPPATQRVEVSTARGGQQHPGPARNSFRYAPMSAPARACAWRCHVMSCQVPTRH